MKANQSKYTQPQNCPQSNFITKFTC